MVRIRSDAVPLSWMYVYVQYGMRIHKKTLNICTECTHALRLYIYSRLRLHRETLPRSNLIMEAFA
jgi:hypothetical protein